MSGISFNLDISHFTAANATGSANYSLNKEFRTDGVRLRVYARIPFLYAEHLVDE